MKHSFLLMTLVAVAVVSFIGCKKKSTGNQVKPNPTPTESSYDFTYSGNMYTHNMVTFKSATPSGSTFLWKFGDGTTSTDSMPGHSYYTSDSFVVWLTVNNDSVHATYHGFKINSTVQ